MGEQSSSKQTRDIEDFKTKFKELHDRLNTAAIFQVLHTGKLILIPVSIRMT